MIAVYQVVEADSADRLADLVNREIEQGWQPIGGVACMAYTHQYITSDAQLIWWYTQAMVKVSVDA
jgi:mannose/cellobiose epimerase-like protein (N-acyl-D-glucosamine 2-epimerase family)